MKTDEWIDIWEIDPVRNEEIIFLTGDDGFHWGAIYSDEKLRKCKFHCFICKDDYECDSQVELDERVIYWFPIPIVPESQQKFKSNGN